MSVLATVRSWDPVEGLGVVDCAGTPGGCWVHSSCVAVPGCASLEPGDLVDLEWEACEDQDGYRYRAVRVRLHGQEPFDRPVQTGASGAYRSVLTLSVDAPRSPEPPPAPAG